MARRFTVLDAFVAADGVGACRNRNHRWQQIVAVRSGAALEARIAQLAKRSPGGDAGAQFGCRIAAARHECVANLVAPGSGDLDVWLRCAAPSER